MSKSFRETVCELGVAYVAPLRADAGAFGAAALANILQQRLTPVKPKKPGRIIDARGHYRQRTIPMTDATMKNLDTLVRRINRLSPRKITKNHVAAILLEKAIDQELGRSG